MKVYVSVLRRTGFKKGMNNEIFLDLIRERVQKALLFIYGISCLWEQLKSNKCQY